MLRIPAIPALAEVRTDLPAVIREVAADLRPGVPASRFSPAALQRLLAWSWPENVAELEAVLAALPQIARGELIQVRDLPATLEQTVGPRLSRHEQAERDAICAAMREADGNKSRAARSLGSGGTRCTASSEC